MSICRYCHSRLVGGKTRQCFACGWDWHNSNEPTHSVINWKRLGLEAEGSLVIDLCEAENGERYFDYRNAGKPVENSDFVIETESTTTTDLQEWCFAGVETRLRLSNGDPFWFDEAGYWQTGTALKRIGFIDRSWVGPTDGLFTEESAIRNAVAYGRRLGIAPFYVEFARLVNEDGRPVWFVPLRFDVDADPLISSFLGACVYVEAATGETSSTMNL